MESKQPWSSLAASTELGQNLRVKGLKVAVAESCTGGLLGATLSRVSGSSDYFVGGVISYSNEVKAQMLGVSRVLLGKVGAVSPEVAEAMALGVAAKLGADIGVAITGVAGPDESEGKPAGLIFICGVGGGVVLHRKLTDDRGRDGNREAAVRAGMDLIRDIAWLIAK